MSSSTTLEIVRQRLLDLHDKSCLTWRQISDLPGYQGINHATLAGIARGRDPKDMRVRQLLGLPLPTAHITVVIGYVPEGSMSLGAWRCDCGQWFISNSGNRRKCYICSPYKGKRRKDKERL